MVHEAHALLLGEAGAGAAGDEAHAEAVAGGAGGAAEHLVEALVVGAGEDGHGAFADLEFAQPGGEGGGDGDDEDAAGVVVFALGVGEADGEALEIYVGHGDAGLGEAAAQVHEYLKDIAHPVGGAVFDEVGAGEDDVGIGYFGFLGDGGALDFGLGDGVVIGVFPADGFVEEKGEEFYLHAGGVVPGSAGFAPCEVIGGVLVTDLAREGEAVIAQEVAEIQPGSFGAAEGVFAAVVAGDVAGHPCGEGRAGFGPNAGLGRGVGIGFLVCPAVVGWDATTEGGRFINPPASFEVPAADIPKGGALNALQGCHVEESSPQFPKCKNYRSGGKWRKMAATVFAGGVALLPLHHGPVTQVGWPRAEAGASLNRAVFSPARLQAAQDGGEDRFDRQVVHREEASCVVGGGHVDVFVLGVSGGRSDQAGFTAGVEDGEGGRAYGEADVHDAGVGGHKQGGPCHDGGGFFEGCAAAEVDHPRAGRGDFGGGLFVVIASGEDDAVGNFSPEVADGLDDARWRPVTAAKGAATADLPSDEGFTDPFGEAGVRGGFLRVAHFVNHQGGSGYVAAGTVGDAQGLFHRMGFARRGNDMGQEE